MKKKILVVDDDRATQHLISSLLKKAGYTVATAVDGKEALEEAHKKKFDLVLLDVWMPGMSGLEVLHELGKMRRVPRVIMLTSDEAPETVLQAVLERAYMYIGKPVQSEPLLEAVEQALRPRPKERPIQVVSARPNWVELLVPCDRESAERVQSFIVKLKSDLPAPVRETVGQAFRELLLNAVEWGGKLDPKKDVRIAYVRTERMLLYRIADPGQGFQFKELEHCALTNTEDQPFHHTEVREAKGIRPGGYGILMTRGILDELVYNEKQNEVLLVKYLK